MLRRWTLWFRFSNRMGLKSLVTVRMNPRAAISFYDSRCYGSHWWCKLAWPFIDQMNPAADTLAMSTTEVDITSVAEGQSIMMWRGKPVFIRHRTTQEIEEAKAVDVLRCVTSKTIRIVSQKRNG